MTCSQCINIALSGSSVNRRSSSLRRATVCKAKPLCFCRPCRGWGGLTMLPILSTLLPQMTVSVASRLVAESRDWPHTQTQTPGPGPGPGPGHEAHTAIISHQDCGSLLSRTSLTIPAHHGNKILLPNGRGRGRGAHSRCILLEQQQQH